MGNCTTCGSDKGDCSPCQRRGLEAIKDDLETEGATHEVQQDDTTIVPTPGLAPLDEVDKDLSKGSRPDAGVIDFKQLQKSMMEPSGHAPPIVDQRPPIVDQPPKADKADKVAPPTVDEENPQFEETPAQKPPPQLAAATQAKEQEIWQQNDGQEYQAQAPTKIEVVEVARRSLGDDGIQDNPAPGFQDPPDVGFAKSFSFKGLEDGIGQPLLWERFLAADFPSKVPCCGFCCILIIVLLIVFLGFNMIKMSEAFGFFVLGDKTTQAYAAHQHYLRDREYFTENQTAGKDVDVLIKQRAQPIPLATIFYEVKGTKCPGDECDLISKNLITAKFLGYMKSIEEKIWSDKTFQEKYCALLKPNKEKCYPPKSVLSMMLWGDGVGATKASKALADEGYWNIPGVVPANCPSWQSPMDKGNACSTPAWTYAGSNSGAAEPADLQSYASVIDKLCTPDDNYFASLRESLLPNFACKEEHMKKHGVPFIRSHLLFGLPWEKDTNRSEMNKMWDEVEGLADKFGVKFLKLYTDVIKDVLGGDEDINVVVISPVSDSAYRNAMQMATLSFTGLSFLLVFLYMWFNVESIFLAGFGMLQVLFSLFPTVIVWNIYNKQGVQFLQFLAVFMILGIGADDTFVLNDAWKQAKHELAHAGDLSKVHIFTLAYRRSFFAMLATTMTTAFAFFFGVFNPIPAIANFCIFACLIVIFDFLLCITMFAACVAFHERFMVGHVCCCCGPNPPPGTCCQQGCCWGCTRIVWRKCRRIPADRTTDQRSLELFFSGPLLNFLKRFRYHLIIFWVLLLVGAAVSAAIFVKIAEKDPEGLPSDHPLQRADSIQRDYFTEPDPSKVVVAWGLSDKGAVSKWDAESGETPEQIEFMDLSAALSQEGQQKILKLCNAPTEEAGSLRCFDKSCLVKGASTKCETKTSEGITYNVEPLCQSGRYCIMEQVKEYADNKFQETGNQKFKFPLADFDAVVSEKGFIKYIIDTLDKLREVKQHWHAENYEDNTGIVLEDSKVKYMWMTFNATFEGAFLPPKVGTKIYEDWEAFVKSHASGTKYYQLNIMYLFKVLQDILVREAFKSIGFSLGVAFVTLALVTWNWAVSLLGLFSISAIIVYFLGLWPVLGWELDIYNVIFCIMAVGLSVDYTVHLLHAYNECRETKREDRVAAALSSMGITVLSGAITTLLAAAPLLATIPTFFNRFGKFVFITIMFSILTSIFLLVPLLLVIGPNGTFGDIQPFYWLHKKCCKRGGKPTE